MAPPRRTIKQAPKPAVEDDSVPTPGTAERPKEPPKDTAPKANNRGGARPGAGRPPNLNIATRSKEMLEQIGALMMMGGMATESQSMLYDGKVITVRAESTGKALEQLARDVPAVRKAFDALFKTSSWSMVAMSLAQVAIPIAACHGLVPNNSFIVGPFVTAEIGLPPERKPKAKPEPKPTIFPEDTGPITDQSGNVIVLNTADNGAY